MRATWVLSWLKYASFRGQWGYAGFPHSSNKTFFFFQKQGLGAKWAIKKKKLSHFSKSDAICRAQMFWHLCRLAVLSANSTAQQHTVNACFPHLLTSRPCLECTAAVSPFKPYNQCLSGRSHKWGLLSSHSCLWLLFAPIWTESEAQNIQVTHDSLQYVVK